MNLKKTTLSVVAVVGLVIAAYTIGLNQSHDENTSESAVSSSSNVGKLEPGAVLAPDHPPFDPNTANKSDTGQASTQPASSNTKFTHFRVGNRNVKSIYAEDDATTGRYRPARRRR